MFAARWISLASLVIWLAFGMGCSQSEPPAPGADAGTATDGGAEPSSSDAGTDAGSQAMRGAGGPCATDEDCLVEVDYGDEVVETSDLRGTRCIEGACGCRTSADCGVEGSLGVTCDTALLGCVDCIGDDDCQARGLAACVDGICRECVTDSDCPYLDSPFCNGGSCAECADDSHCEGSAAGRVCLWGWCGCEVDSDCDPGWSCSDESCG